MTRRLSIASALLLIGIGGAMGCENGAGSSPDCANPDAGPTGPLDGGGTVTPDVSSPPSDASPNDATAVDATPAGPFTIGGTLSGLFGGGAVVLQDNLGDDLTLTADGPFTFATPLATGKTYSVTILTVPSPAVTCTASANTGAIGAADVSSVVVSCKLSPGCAALHAVAPWLDTGFYPISIGNADYLAYCDMVTDGGGWTQVFDQDVTVGDGFLPGAAWAAGVNMQLPNSGQYSILPLLDTLKGASPTFEFLLDWPLAPSGSVEWTQVENPLATNALPTVSNVVENPAGQTDNCGGLAFRGLSLTTSANAGAGVALLNGDASTTCYFWALGTASLWGDGIPTYGALSGTPRARLWVRTQVGSAAVDAGPPDVDAAAFSPCPTDGGACAIMPLGDSITFGYQSSTGGGYRVQLIEDIWAATRSATFVGSSTSGPTTLEGQPFPQENEGHSGYTIDDAPAIGADGIALLVPGSLSTYKPNIVTLMIGTNDVNRNNDLANAPFRLGHLIDTITELSPDALVVVAQITPTTTATENVAVQAYNAAIPGLVQSRVAEGKHILLVDMYDAFMTDPTYATDYMADDLHPNDTGYALMGNTWYAAIAPYLH